MQFWPNVVAELKARGMTAKALAEQIGVTPGAFTRYARGSSPGLDIAVRIARALDVSLDSLVLSPDSKPRRETCPDPAAHDIVEQLGLENLLLLARLGSHALAWDVAIALARKHPQPVTLGKLRDQLRHSSEDDLRGTLLLLEKQDILSSHSGDDGTPMYLLTQPAATFAACDLSAQSIHVNRAVSVTLQRVLPGLERADGSAYLLTASACVPDDVGRSMVQKLRTLVKDECASLSDYSGGAELNVVMGVVVSKD